jgi:hypothetical protein
LDGTVSVGIDCKVLKKKIQINATEELRLEYEA